MTTPFRASKGLTPTVSAALFLEAMTVSITAIAIPVMQRDFAVELSIMQWAHGAFIIGFAGLLLFGGRVSDLFGRRRVFLWSVTIFGLAALGVSLSQELLPLFVSRTFQGAAAAFMIPSAIAMLTDAFPEGAARNRALSTFNAVGAAGFSAGLVIGGFIIEFLGWRWSFAINAPAAALILVFGLVVCPRGARDQTREPLDAMGAVSITAAIMLATVSLTIFGEEGLSATVLGAGCLAILCGAVFMFVESRHRHPLLPLGMFKIKGFGLANLASLTLLGSFFGFNLLASVRLQDVLSLSSLGTGLVLLPMGVICVVIAQVLTPRLVDRYGAAIIAACGLLFVGAGAAVLGLAADRAGPLVVLIAGVLAGGFGMGLAYAPLVIAAVTGVSTANSGVAAALQQTALQVGGVLGIALSVAAIGIIGREEAGLFMSMAIAMAGIGASLLLKRRTAGLELHDAENNQRAEQADLHP